MPAPRIVKDEQVEMLCSAVKTHPLLIKGGNGKGPVNRAMISALWQRLARQLNGVKGGLCKTPERWRDYWNDLKSKSRASQKNLLKIRQGTPLKAITRTRTPVLSEIHKMTLRAIGEAPEHFESIKNQQSTKPPAPQNSRLPIYYLPKGIPINRVQVLARNPSSCSSPSPPLSEIDESSQIFSESSQMVTESSQMVTEPSQIFIKASQMGKESSQMAEPSQIFIKSSQMGKESSQMVTESQMITEPSIFIKPSQMVTEPSQIFIKPSQMVTETSQIHTELSQLNPLERKQPQEDEPAPVVKTEAEDDKGIIDALLELNKRQQELLDRVTNGFLQVEQRRLAFDERLLTIVEKISDKLP